MGGSTPVDELAVQATLARYWCHDELVRLDGEWRIARRDALRMDRPA
ncbi:MULTISPECIES: hypothetical protein [unclassified Parafrankia]|nr:MULTISPECIES: hypothetical protein [unclassified Parafrankia]